MFTASAPGKIILFGEHAVVYGQPAIAIPVTQVQTTVTIRPLEAGSPPRIRAPQIGLDGPLHEAGAGFWGAAVLEGVRAALRLDSVPPFEMEVRSDIPVASGLGSGAAAAVASIRALAAFAGSPLEDERVNALAYEVEKIHHGTPSGIDNTVIAFARPVYFVRGQPIETLAVRAPFTIIIADTGIPSPTAETVGDVRRAWQAEPARHEAIFAEIGGIAARARRGIERGDIAPLGGLMTQNHALLHALGVSSPALDQLVSAAMRSGAGGAKLSGGGRGGNLIALAAPQAAPAVADALRAAGAAGVLTTTVAP
jgi:mevalonate kinase